MLRTRYFFHRANYIYGKNNIILDPYELKDAASMRLSIFLFYRCSHGNNSAQCSAHR
jgi:hypothetical protein